MKGSSLPLWSAMTLAEYEESKRRQEAAPLVHIPLDQPQYCIGMKKRGGGREGRLVEVRGGKGRGGEVIYSYIISIAKWDY